LKIVAILYPGGKTAKNNPDLLGCAENALGLRDFLERNGHELVVLTDKESELDRHLPSTDVLLLHSGLLILQKKEFRMLQSFGLF
jgi:formate dehydrogenase